MNYSYWESQYNFENIDFCVIGAGIVGSCAALFLRDHYPDARILVLERGSLPQGASTKNAGFSCFGSISEMEDDLQHMSETEIADLVQLRVGGLNLLKTLIDPIKMEFHKWGGFEVFKEGEEEAYIPLLEKYNEMILEATGLRSTFSVKESNMDTKFSSKMIFNRHEGQLNPMKMMHEFHKKLHDKNINILYGQELVDFKKQEENVQLTVKKDQTFEAKKVLFCTNAFVGKFLPDLDVSPGRNQVLVTKPLQNFKLRGTFNFDKGFVYFRNVANRLLIGGARNLDSETEKTTDFGDNTKITDHLKSLVNDYILPGQEVEYDYQWSGIIGVGKSKNPIVQKVDDCTFIAVRLGGMGVAIGSQIGKNLADLVYNS